MTRKASVYPRPTATSHPIVRNNRLQRKHNVSGQSLSGRETAMQFADRMALGLDQDFSQLPVRSTPLPIIQTKLTVGQPNDKYEQEADRVAEQVMRMPAPESVGTQIQRTPLPHIQRACSACEEEKKLQTKEIIGSTPEVTPAVASRIQSLQGRGQPLSATTRNFFEPRFERDFSHVRVHTDSTSTRELNARAYTFGHNIVFGTGEYSPQTNVGKKLLAHELTHTIQQSNAQIHRQILGSQEANSEAMQAQTGRCYTCEIEGGIGICCYGANAPVIPKCLDLGKRIIDRCEGDSRNCLQQAQCAQCKCLRQINEQYCQCTGIV